MCAVLPIGLCRCSPGNDEAWSLARNHLGRCNKLAAWSFLPGDMENMNYVENKSDNGSL